jgi:hypothetical protein
LQSFTATSSPLVFLDPEFRGPLDRLKFGNEGERQRGRASLPAMSETYIDAIAFEIARVLAPSGYCMRWVDTFSLFEAHLRLGRHHRADRRSVAAKPRGMLRLQDELAGLFLSMSRYSGGQDKFSASFLAKLSPPDLVGKCVT